MIEGHEEEAAEICFHSFSSSTSERDEEWVKDENKKMFFRENFSFIYLHRRLFLLDSHSASASFTETSSSLPKTDNGTGGCECVRGRKRDEWKSASHSKHWMSASRAPTRCAQWTFHRSEIIMEFLAFHEKIICAHRKFHDVDNYDDDDDDDVMDEI